MADSFGKPKNGLDNIAQTSVNVTDEKSEITRARLVTVDEACRFLRVGRHMLYRLINTRELISVKIGMRRLISLGALTDYVRREETKYES